MNNKLIISQVFVKLKQAVEEVQIQKGQEK